MSSHPSPSLQFERRTRSPGRPAEPRGSPAGPTNSVPDRAPNRLGPDELCSPLGSIQRDRFGNPTGSDLEIQRDPIWRSNGIRFGNPTGSDLETQTGSDLEIQRGPIWRLKRDLIWRSNGIRFGDPTGSDLEIQRGPIWTSNRIRFRDPTGSDLETPTGSDLEIQPDPNWIGETGIWQAVFAPRPPSPLIFKTTPSPSGLGINVFETSRGRS